MLKSKALQKIEKLDPKKDAWEIVRLSVYYEFPWDFNRALELALYKTFAVPSIAKILHQSKEFEHHPQKRYDDTDLILSEIIENGLENERGKKAIEQLNFIHSHYPITNEDNLYVLSTFIFDTIDWINRFGYRKISTNEALAGFYVWKEIGEAMYIQNIPNSISELKAYHDDFEKKHFSYTAANCKVATATENLMLSWYVPKFMNEMARPFLHAVMQPHLLEAFHYKQTNPLLKNIVSNTLRIRSKVGQIFSSGKPFIRTRDFKHKSYLNGYEIEKLGPEKLLKNKVCPYHKVMQTINPSK